MKAPGNGSGVDGRGNGSGRKPSSVSASRRSANIAKAITHLNAPLSLGRPLQFVLEQNTPTVEEALRTCNFSYTQVGGKPFITRMTPTSVEVPATTAERIRDMIGLRDITRDLIEARLNGGSEDTITDLQQKTEYRL